MTENLTRIYALLICFVCMVCLTITTGMAIYQVVKIVDPLLVASGHQYRLLQSPEAFVAVRNAPPSPVAVQVRSIDGMITSSAPAAELADLTDAELEERRQLALQSLVENSRHDARASLIRLTIVLLISSVVFYIHWRLAHRKPEVA